VTDPETNRALSSKEHVNTVHLRGRLAAAPETRELPSGDVLVTLRLVVARPAGRRRVAASGRAAAVRRRVLRWEPGDQVVIEGSLRRRFWRGPGGAQSRYDVEVVKARRETRS